MTTKTRKREARSRMTEVLNSSEQLFRALIENSSDAVALVSQESIFLYLSPTVQKILGFTPEELLGRNIRELFPPDQLGDVLAKFQAVKETPGLTITVEHPYLHKDGSLLWLESTVTNHLDDPSIQAYVANFRNITQRKQAEQRQHLLNQASQLLVSSLVHRITLQEIAELIVPALADYCRIGLVDEQQQSIDIQVNHIDPAKMALVQELYDHYKDRTGATYGLQKILATGQPELIPEVFQSVQKASQDIPGLLRITDALGLQSYMGVPLIASERVIGAITFSSIQPSRHYTSDDLLFAQELAHRIALSLDNARLYSSAQVEIAERKQAEAALQTSEERLRLALEAGDIGVWDWDVQHNILTWSEKVYSLHGVARETFVPTFENLLNLVHPEDKCRVQEAFEKALQEQMPFSINFRIVTPREESRWLTTRGKVIYDVEGEPIRMLGATSDITEQKELEKRKDEFISMASHELKTPITSLKGFANVLQRRLSKQGDDQGLVYLAKMDRQVNRLTQLITDLLDISKMQTGKLIYREERFDLSLLIQEVMENLQETTLTHQLCLEETRQAEVFGDRDRIGQVLINLLTNAIKYSPGADRVLVRLTTDANSAIVSVQDFGIGIAEDQQQKIFERFYQVTNEEEKTYPGLGIGLYLSSEIIKRHHGHIWVESSKRAGATFSISLPLIKEE